MFRRQFQRAEIVRFRLLQCAQRGQCVAQTDMGVGIIWRQFQGVLK